MNTHSLDLEASSSQFAAIVDGSQTGLDFSNTLSIEAWVKMETSGGVIASKYNEQGNQRGYKFSINGGYLSYQYSSNGAANPGSYDVTASTNQLVVGSWYHAAVTVTTASKDIKFYVNGVLCSNGSSNDNSAGTSILNTTADFALGKYQINGPANSDFFDGLLDEVRLWSDIRTQAELVDNMYKQISASEGGLVAYYRLNNSYLDETSNNNDLTSSGSPTFITTDKAPVDRTVVTAFML